jgi:hypothetical protein
MCNDAWWAAREKGQERQRRDRRRRVALRIGGIGGALLGFTACTGESPLTASHEARQNVMVIDEGIDLSSAELRGKTLAAFTITCPDQGTVDAGEDAGTAAPDGGTSPSFDERKQAYLAELATPADSCHLVPGISAKPDPLASVRAYRDRWNAMLRGQRYGNTAFAEGEWNVVTDALDFEFQTFAYHGTATSGTVAHDNPGVRMVLVERQLAPPGSLATSFKCLVQADIDEWVAVLTDPEVRTAYSNVPPSAYTEEFRNVVAEYNVGVVNESYGRPARAVLEKLQISQGCPTAISLGPYFAAWDDLHRAWNEAHGVPVPYVWTQSAGNDAAQIDTASDSYECTPGDDRHLLVGSTNLAQARSQFTNYGACVDLYAPGEEIIAPYAGGWLLPVKGTSFSAPLMARLISRAALSPYDAAQARQQAIATRDGTWTVPIATFPRDFFYAPDTTGTKLSALTAAPAGPAQVMPGRSRDLDPIDWSRRSLGPLHALIRPPLSR